MAQKAIALGKAIIDGIINGIKSGTGAVANAVWDLGKNIAVGGLANAIDSHSPSEETMKIGGYFTEGFGLGIENKAPLVKEKVKKIAKTALDELRKQVADAMKDFNFLAGSTEAQSLTVESGMYQDAKSKLEELIKLRDELGANVGRPIPLGLDEITKELEGLNQAKSGLDEAKKMLQDFENAAKGIGAEKTNLEKVINLLADPTRAALIDAETQARLRSAAADRDAADAAKKLKEAKDSISQGGCNERNDLQTQIDSFAVNVNSGLFEQISDDVELERIKRAGEMLKWLAENKSKFSAEELADLQKLKEAENERYLEMLKQLQAQKDLATADKAYLDLTKELDGNLAELNSKLSGNTDLTELNRVAKMLETEAYKNLTKEQRDNLLVKAQEIDQAKEQIKAAEEAKKEFEKTANALAGSLLRIFQAGVSGGFKGFLRQIFEELKNFGKKLLDDVLNQLSQSLSRFILGKLGNLGGGSSSGGGSGFGGIFDTIKKLFGGSGNRSAGGVPTTGTINAAGEFVVNGGSSSGGGIIEAIRNFFGGGSGGSRSAAGNGIDGFVDSHGNPLKSGGGFGVGAGIALGASVLGGLIGGRAGTLLSAAGSGLGIGLAIGGPVGALVGVGVGALSAILGGLFSDPKRKRDKNEKLPQLQKGFTDALAQLRALGADKNSFYQNPEATIAKAIELRGQIASGFGLQFESKKYQNRLNSKSRGNWLKPMRLSFN